MTQDLLAEDVNIGADAGGPVEVRKLPDGRAILLPASPNGRRLNAEALQCLADCQSVLREISQLRDELDELVALARECHAPWSLIGFSLGMTGEAARKRWTD